MPGSAVEEATPPHSPLIHSPLIHSPLVHEGSSSRSPFVPTADQANAKPSIPLPACKCSPRRQLASHEEPPVPECKCSPRRQPASHEEPPLRPVSAAQPPSEVISSHLVPTPAVALVEVVKGVKYAEAPFTPHPFTPHSSLHTEGHEAPWLQSAMVSATEPCEREHEAPSLQSAVVSAKEQWLNGNMEAARKILSESFLANPACKCSPRRLAESFLANPHTVHVASTPPTGAVQVGSTRAPNGPPRSAVHASALHGARSLRDGPRRSAVHCSFHSDVQPSGTHGRTQERRTDHRIDLETLHASAHHDAPPPREAQHASAHHVLPISKAHDGRVSQQPKQPPEDGPRTWRQLFDAWRKE